MLPRYIPAMPVGRKAQPFDHPDWFFELKYDGFRALAYVDDCGGTRMISRQGNVYRAFPRLTGAIADELKGREAVLDGEIVCFSGDGKPRFSICFADDTRRTSAPLICCGSTAGTFATTRSSNASAC